MNCISTDESYLLKQYFNSYNKINFEIQRLQTCHCPKKKKIYLLDTFVVFHLNDACNLTYIQKIIPQSFIIKVNFRCIVFENIKIETKGFLQMKFSFDSVLYLTNMLNNVIFKKCSFIL